MTLTDNAKLACGEDNDGWYLEHGAAQIAYGLRHGQANRIVACVNACKGSSTEWLRGYGDMLNACNEAKSFQKNISNLGTQRDELLSALKHHQEQTRPIQQTMDILAKYEYAE